MTKIYYRVPEFWRKEDKSRFLQEKQSIVNIEWQKLIPNEKHTWLTEDLHAEFGSVVDV